MRKLAPLLLLLAPACTTINPEFNDCSLAGECVADAETTEQDSAPESGAESNESETTGAQGEEDTAEQDSTDEPETEGEGEEDAGEEEAGEEGLLPACPAVETVEIGMLQDTFLDTSQYNFGGCVIAWDYGQDLPVVEFGIGCGTLDFGGHEDHWVCSGSQCRSAWLGQFALGGLVDYLDTHEGEVEVAGARVEFSALFGNEEPKEARLYAFEAGVEEFGNCESWSAGPGEGIFPEDCVTTGNYSAFPKLWSQFDPLSLSESDEYIGEAFLPAYGDDQLYSFEIAFEPSLVEGWLETDNPNAGLLLATDGEQPTDFNLQSSSSEDPPRLFVDLCEP